MRREPARAAGAAGHQRAERGAPSSGFWKSTRSSRVFDCCCFHTKRDVLTASGALPARKPTAHLFRTFHEEGSQLNNSGGRTRRAGREPTLGSSALSATGLLQTVTVHCRLGGLKCKPSKQSVSNTVCFLPGAWSLKK